MTELDKAGFNVSDKEYYCYFLPLGQELKLATTQVAAWLWQVS
jgi:hypothetical protein